jgi:hypothetical protein
MALMNAYCVFAVQQAVRVIGGIAIVILALPFYCRHGGGLLTAGMKIPVTGWMRLKILSGFIVATPS